MGNHILRRIAFYSGSIIAGSVVVDLMRFTAWQNNHDVRLPLLILVGLAVAYCIGLGANYILRSK